jgi:hypothetical protein
VGWGWWLLLTQCDYIIRVDILIYYMYTLYIVNMNPSDIGLPVVLQF